MSKNVVMTNRQNDIAAMASKISQYPVRQFPISSTSGSQLLLDSEKVSSGASWPGICATCAVAVVGSRGVVDVVMK
ncbi:hypothetical protein [Pontibacterium granulatum]|uniref:hypothetical protein n=1 Tax=Pontibacterium granulatum TaxID=2036029 RepID=UPI00249C2CB2|nr:hypothetical protein [Pontibacterium granulatum]